MKITRRYRAAQLKQKFDSLNRRSRLAEQTRKHWLRVKYNFSLKDYDALLLKQVGGCRICHKKNNGSKRFCVDHNHKTGRIRGLLCSRCNSAVGFIREDLDIAMNLLKYLVRDRISD